MCATHPTILCHIFETLQIFWPRSEDANVVWKYSSDYFFTWFTIASWTLCHFQALLHCTIKVTREWVHCQSEMPRPILWNQTADVHRRSTLITWRCRYITWRWRHRNHDNTTTSVISEKQTIINEVYVFSIEYRYREIYKLHLFCWWNFQGTCNQKIDLNRAVSTCYRSYFPYASSG